MGRGCAAGGDPRSHADRAVARADRTGHAERCPEPGTLDGPDAGGIPRAVARASADRRPVGRADLGHAAAGSRHD